MPTSPSERLEWLEADGLGGFASGTAAGLRTRRYHALLLPATQPPAGRCVLVNGVEAWLQTARGKLPLTPQRYVPDVTTDGAAVASFEPEPWPSWSFDLGEGLRVRHELFVPHGRSAAVLSWRLQAPYEGVRLRVRPLFSGRDFHALHHENPAFRFDAERRDGAVFWRPYAAWPAIAARSNGAYTHAPDWYRRFQYDLERERGLDFEEDLATPGIFEWDLSAGEATLVFAAGEAATPGVPRLRESERRRRAAFASPLHRAADAYLVRRGEGLTVIAGYPWFGDWGRDSFIALRGICLATGRRGDALALLLEWSRHVSGGMLPNRFPDAGGAPEYNAVDAALWFVVAVDATLAAFTAAGERVNPDAEARLWAAVDAILAGYAAGTRHGIRADGDGLIAAGSPRTNLTWMDACFEGRPVTPRAGKPVEIQALWLNALWIARGRAVRWRALYEQGIASFRARFWNAARGCLFDVVDVDGVAGTADGRLRPNQLLAIGGLPLPLVEGDRARRVVDVAEAALWTPLGPRSLAPGEAGYVSRYVGDLRARDEAYHQGTVWPWLAGPFVDAWLRVRGGTPDAVREVEARFVAPLHEQFDRFGLGHLPEIADADAPHTPRGCPFQAWSLAEFLRLEAELRAR